MGPAEKRLIGFINLKYRTKPDSFMIKIEAYEVSYVLRGLVVIAIPLFCLIATFTTVKIYECIFDRKKLSENENKEKK